MFPKLSAQRLRLLLIAGLLAPAAMSAVGLFLAVVLRGEAPALPWLPGWNAALLGALVAGISIGTVYGLSKLSERLERALKDTGVKVGEEALRLAGYPVMLVVVTASAVGEEILFRGGLQPSLGVLVTALLFGFSHGGWRREMWAYFLAASISGGLFGLAYLLTGNLWVPIIAHTLHNIAATIFMDRESAEEAAEEVCEDGEAGARVEAEGAGADDAGDREAGGVISDDAVGSVPEPVPTESDSEEPGPEAGPAPDRPRE